MLNLLKVVRQKNKLYFFDKRLKELRNIYNPYDSIQLNDFEIKYFENAKGITLNLEAYFRKLLKKQSLCSRAKAE